MTRDQQYSQAIEILAEYALENDLSPRDVTEEIKIDLYPEMMRIENSTCGDPEVSAVEAEIEAERRLEERSERYFDRYGHFGPGRPDPGPD